MCLPNKRKEYETFSLEVKRVFHESKGRYGAVKIYRSLNDIGTACSLKQVQRHMKEQGLRSVVVKKYNDNANKGTVPTDKENILKRDFDSVLKKEENYLHTYRDSREAGKAIFEYIES